MLEIFCGPMNIEIGVVCKIINALLIEKYSFSLKNHCFSNKYTQGIS
jgi:hypothetical protein